jgi:nucleotide-binding universal stress UspA family protein
MTDKPNGNGRRIVVGVDGSAYSTTALRWAMTQARLTGATIDLVGAWQNPMISGYSFGWSPVLDEGYDMSAITEKVLAETVAEVNDPHGTPLEIRRRAVEGHPAQVLLDAAVGAQLLVLGSRGHGTFAGILLGSVSQHCVQHAPCPVVVIPQETSDSAGLRAPVVREAPPNS